MHRFNFRYAILAAVIVMVAATAIWTLPERGAAVSGNIITSPANDGDEFSFMYLFWKRPKKWVLEFGGRVIGETVRQPSKGTSDPHHGRCIRSEVYMYMRDSSESTTSH